MPEAARKIATERLKWSLAYQQKHGITSGPARDLPEGLEPRVQRLCKRVCNVLYLTGFARVDLRLTPAGEVYVIEANPNPQIAQGEDFADSAAAAGIEYGALLERILKLGLEWDPAAA
jgi:D-alanine-D-alanine ligase